MIRKLLLILVLLSSWPSSAMRLTSQSWQEFSLVGSNAVCPSQGGDNISPQLSWTEAPDNTKSFLLFLHDPDAPHSAGFVHWVVYIHNPEISALQPGFVPTPTVPIAFGLNGMNKNAYFGPCAPNKTGLHRYVFTLYALNTQLKLNKIAKLHQSDLINLLPGKVLDQATFTGFYRYRL